MNWHKFSTQEVFELLGTNPQGLHSAMAEERLIEYGRNELDTGKKKSIALLFLEQFKDLMIIILLISAFISGIIGDLVDTIVILIIVVLNALLGFFQQYRAEKAMQVLKQMTIPKSRVMRNGILSFLSTTELVVGDIVLLESGNAVQLISAFLNRTI